MNHQNHHDDIQITDVEVLQSNTNSIPPISSLISNIQTIPLSEYNVSTINPTLIDFSLLDHQPNDRNHRGIEHKGAGIHSSPLSNDPVEINQMCSSSSSSIPCISSLVNGIHSAQHPNEYNINQINPTFGDYGSNFSIGDDSAILNDFSLHKKLERKNIHLMPNTKVVTSIQDNSPDSLGSNKSDFHLTETDRNEEVKKIKKAHSMHASDFNNEKYESLSNLNSTLDLLVAVSCQINERNQLKKDTKPFKIENDCDDTKFIDNHPNNLMNQNQNLNAEKNKSKLQRAKSLPQSAIDIMIQYFDAHSEHPYPSLEDRRKMSIEGKITENQVKAWFANRRNRAKKRCLKAATNLPPNPASNASLNFASNSFTNPSLNFASNSSLNSSSKFSPNSSIKSVSASNFVALINRDKICRSPPQLHNICERNKEGNPIYRSVFKLNPIPSNIICPERVNYRPFGENLSDKKENNSHRITLKAKPRTQPKIKQKIVETTPTAPPTYMFQPVEDIFQDDSGNTSSADDHYMPSMNENNFDSINADNYHHHHHFHHNNQNLDQISPDQNHPPHLDHISMPLLDNYKFQQHQSKLMINNNNSNNNNNNLYFPNLNCINKHNSEECLDSCCYLKSNYSSIYNEVSNLNDSALNESLNDQSNLNYNANNFLNLFSNVNHLGGGMVTPSCYQNFFQQQKCETPPPLVTKSSPCRFSSNEVSRVAEKLKCTENQTLHLPINLVSGNNIINNNNNGLNSDSLNLINTFCKTSYQHNKISSPIIRDNIENSINNNNDFNIHDILDTSSSCSTVDSKNQSNDSVQNSTSHFVHNNKHFCLKDSINNFGVVNDDKQMQDQECHLDHLDDEYTSPSSNSSSNSSNNSDLKSHNHLSILSPESYQALKQQSLLYVGFDGNQTNEIQSQNFSPQFQSNGNLNESRNLKPNKKTLIKQNERFIEPRPSILHPKISANTFMNILSKK